MEKNHTGFFNCVNLFFHADGSIAPHDPMGLPWTREEWLGLREAIDAYFATNPDKQIEQARQAFFARIDEPSWPQRAKPPVEKPNAKLGYLYLLHGEGTQWYKIGFSTMPDTRHKWLATQAPFPIAVVSCSQVDDMPSAERWWHREFADKRVNGEWFALDDSDVAYFVAIEGKVSP